ncbi:RNA polymerase factor sigma-54 [Candidatus Nucleicultrix amoebiphila]|jgi:RNA polymerase sigma-54 factor|uniref:RNA polymerase sigma-54 factor n=1 Tax=Candidatus Nucleicultrix amoebiphila FS5 TaxID=1414854 RepID=A0A1W6N412_9PROT|nr:RNA polymerase factor sigma-54 [Candidatus Nucleicultrix amoebiphila]ARN84595.1 hypothetical protein GQ61_03885 [Candidatus Nucleicultrix amoebiphila FS5]
MKTTQGLIQRQQQTLTLTPQLRQAIKLLELSNLDLALFISQTLNENPLLTLDPPDGLETSLSEKNTEGEEFDGEEFDNIWTNDSDSDRWQDQPNLNKKNSFDDSEGNNLERLAANSENLTEHLLSQLNTDIRDPVERLIGAQLIELVDNTGYIFADFSNLAEQLGCSVDFLESLLIKLQCFDPPGVFARNLKECLTLQLQDQGNVNKKMQKVIDHLDLLAEHRIDKLLKECVLNRDELIEITKKIRELDPKPGLRFEQTPSQTVIPDVMITFDKNEGKWRAHLNEATMPRIWIDQKYYKQLNENKAAKDTRKYLSEQYGSANALLKALAQRQSTILKVSEAIVEHQQTFFNKGIKGLKPMVLRDIAEIIGMHESTVSRVTSNKYMATPRGTFELKYFFTVAYTHADTGEDLSSETIRHQIKELVEKEDPNQPFSDDQIVKILSTKGVPLARRTVAKYRDALKLPSSYERKRRKNVGF